MVSRADGQPSSWSTVNISDGGMFIAGTPVIPPGTLLDLAMRIPSGERVVDFKSQVRVVWNNDPTSTGSNPHLPPGMGVEFVGLDGDSQRLLRETLYGDANAEGTPVPSPDADAALPNGTILGAYRIIDLLGRGGMGEVYIGEHVALGRRVALKRLSARCANDADAVRRFFDEGRLVNRVRHDHVVEVTDFVTDGTEKYYVMELLHGATLEDLLRRHEQLPVERVLSIAIQLTDALAAVHRAGIVHRDLKPSNIILIERAGCRDYVKLLDFGVAKQTGAAKDNALFTTRQGMAVGTPGYMSPEQSLGATSDSQSDIYAVGVILWTMLTGRVLFAADNWVSMLRRHLVEDPEPPSRYRADLPPPLDELVLACLAKEPAQRPCGAATLLKELRAIADTPTGALAGPIARLRWHVRSMRCEWRRGIAQARQLAKGRRAAVPIGVAAATVLIAALALAMSAFGDREAEIPDGVAPEVLPVIVGPATPAPLPAAAAATVTGDGVNTAAAAPAAATTPQSAPEPAATDSSSARPAPTVKGKAKRPKSQPPQLERGAILDPFAE